MKRSEIKRLEDVIRAEGALAQRTGDTRCPYKMSDALNTAHLKGIMHARKLWQEGYDRAAAEARAA